MSITIKDIARQAHIDPGAVSRTLRNDPEALRLRPETRERIVRIARELGYRRNLLAASTRTGVVNIIGVIGSFPQAQLSFSYARMLDGLITECADNGFTVKFYADTNLSATLEEIAGTLIRHLICITPDHATREQVAQFCRQNQLKLVFVYESPHQSFPSLNGDNHLAARLAVRHLAALGHRRIGLLCVPHHRFHYIDERHQGFLDGLEEAGLPAEPQLIACTDQTSEAVEAMLDLPPKQRPTALFAIADNLAAVAQQVAVRRGLRLPEDLSTCGLGNSDICSYTACPLTSLDEQLQDYGRFATRIVLGKPSELTMDAQGIYRLTPTLVRRQSTAPCFSHPNLEAPRP